MTTDAIRSILQSDLGPLTDAFDRLDSWEQEEVVERLQESLALAAATRQGGDVQRAPAESPQSGPERGNAQ